MCFIEKLQLLVIFKKTLNSCCFSSLASDFSSNKHFIAANSIAIRIKEPLKIEVGNRIHFANDIMLNNKRNKGEASVYTTNGVN